MLINTDEVLSLFDTPLHFEESRDHFAWEDIRVQQAMGVFPAVFTIIKKDSLFLYANPTTLEPLQMMHPSYIWRSVNWKEYGRDKINLWMHQHNFENSKTAYPAFREMSKFIHFLRYQEKEIENRTLAAEMRSMIEEFRDVLLVPPIDYDIVITLG